LSGAHWAIVPVLLMAGTASGQDAPKADPVEANLSRQWQAAQTGQQNVAEALSALVEAYRKEKARADAAEVKLKAAETPK
jgi:hypothetical protein